MEKRIRYWLRWIAAVPIAILAALVVSVLVRSILYYTVFIFLSPTTTIAEAGLTSVLNAAGFIFIGSMIAPDRNNKTLLILFLVFLGLTGVFALLSFSGAELFGKKLASVNGLSLFAFSVLGACIGLSLANNSYKKLIARR